MSGVDANAEQVIKDACSAKDFEVATTRAFEAYGSEILTFLIARLRSESDGEEAFSMFAEDLWKAMPGFGFRCSARGYLYTLARNAANRHATAPHKRAARNLPVSAHASLSALVDRTRSATQAYRRTDVKDRVRALRERLPEDDQTLLILHIDRALPWREIAMVVHELGENLDGEPLERECARLRKRFERVKAELKAMAEKEGLLKR
jgi:RNA polymerase sigma-70 factor (ECF subfamily)